jgi:membrane protein DedA with SNARE-associated domain
VEEFQLLLANHGVWLLALVVLADQLGLPIPAPPALIVVGGLIGSGEIPGTLALAVSTAAVLPADLLWFEMGRRKGNGIMKLLCRLSLEPDSCVRSTRASFERRGSSTLLFAKFVPGLQTIAPPLAGASGMSHARFLAWSLPGALLWSGSFLALGALLREQVELFLELLSTFGAGVVLVLVGGLALWIGWKFLHRQRFLRALRVARISPDAVREMIERGAEPAIFDLREASEIEFEGHTIPGARRLGLDELDDRHHEIPRDRDIILYCT